MADFKKFTYKSTPGFEHVLEVVDWADRVFDWNVSIDKINPNNPTITVRGVAYPVENFPKPEPQPVTVPAPQPIPKPKDPPPPSVEIAPAKNTFIPAALLAGPYYTKGGEFRKKSTGEDYVGDYIRVVEGRYRTGKSIQEPGEELILVSSIQTARDTVNNWVDTNIIGKVKKLGIKNPLNALNLSGIFDISSILTTLLTLAPTEREKRKGEMKRYIIQDKNTLKIAEVDKDTFLLAKNNLFNKRFAEIPWKISGPAEDTTIAGYPAVGVSTVNKNTINTLEKEIPGISTFITDFTFLLQTPEPRDREIFTEEKVTTSPLSALEAFKKANFDKKD